MASACAATKFTRAGYEEASHKVLKKEGSVELRHYSELQLVETTMSSDQDNGFMRLFRYIDGGNDKQQKIAMTTPVFTTKKNGESTMAFVLPDKFNREDVPLPNLDSVKNVTQPEMLFAAYRYSGRHQITPVKIDSKLREWVKENDLVAVQLKDERYQPGTILDAMDSLDPRSSSEKEDFFIATKASKN